MVEIVNATRTKLQLKSLEHIAEFVLARFKASAKEVSIAIIGDIKMRRHNADYRGKDRPTDVLSFTGEGQWLGEILLDYQQIKRQAKRLGHTAKFELEFITIHGLLHLFGYNDETEVDRLKMIALGDNILKEYYKK
ncbi:MAG: rRNA maturation RNase YbeY [Candidatus Falkowbacteria bacterium]